jgi:hypothetical protein
VKQSYQSRHFYTIGAGLVDILCLQPSPISLMLEEIVSEVKMIGVVKVFKRRMNVTHFSVQTLDAQMYNSN